MKEVIYNCAEPEYSDKPCPHCSQKKLQHGLIPCPDGKVGCLVAHYGYTCMNCFKIFQ